MKVRLLLSVFLPALILQSCTWLYPAPLPERKMVIYYASAHNNSLSGSIASNVQDLRDGYLPDIKDTNNVMMVYYHLADNRPRLSRFAKNDNDEFVEEILMDYPHSATMPTYSLEEISISQVIVDAQTAFPSTRRSLIISTHGSGYFPENYTLYDETTSKAVGPDDNIAIGLPELADAITGYHYDLIVFDCCFMGGIETVAEFADICDYVIGAPTETMTAGMTRYDTVEPLFKMEPEAAGMEICKRFMTHARQESAYSSSATVALYKTANFPSLASICNTIFDEAGSKTSTISIDEIQKYHRSASYWFFDLDDFIKQLLTDSEGTVDPSYSTFQSALSDVVIYKDCTPQFLGLTIDTEKYSGISTYIPRSNYEILNEYYRRLEWNKETKLVN